MAHRIIFTNTPSINTSLRQKFVVGSGVGSRNRSVYRALQNRASNDAHGKPCCIPATNIEQNAPPVIIMIDIADIANLNPDGTYTLKENTTIPAGYELDINGVTLTLGEFTLTNNGIIIISGKNGPDGLFLIDNNFTNTSTGIVTNSIDPGTITITDVGYFLNEGIFNNENIFNINGSLNNIGTINNIVTTGIIKVNNTGKFYNNNICNNEYNIIFYGNCLFINNKIINNGNTAYIEFRGNDIISNTTGCINSETGSIINNGDMLIWLYFTNNGSIINDNLLRIQNDSNSTLYNNNKLYNNGTLAAQIVINKGDIYNYNTINAYEYLFNNSGNIYYFPNSIYIGYISGDKPYQTVIVTNIATTEDSITYTLLSNVTTPVASTLTIENGITLVVTVPFINSGTVIIDNGGIITNQSTITTFGNMTNNGLIDNTGVIRNYGILTNNQIINNNNLIANVDNGKISNNNNIFNYVSITSGDYSITNDGNIYYFPGSNLTGTIDGQNPFQTVSLTNIATTEDSITYTLLSNVTTPVASTLTIENGITLVVTVPFISYGIVTIDNGGILTNQSTIDNYNTLTNSGTIENYNLIYNIYTNTLFGTNIINNGLDAHVYDMVLKSGASISLNTPTSITNANIIAIGGGGGGGYGGSGAILSSSISFTTSSNLTINVGGGGSYNMGGYNGGGGGYYGGGGMTEVYNANQPILIVAGGGGGGYYYFNGGNGGTPNGENGQTAFDDDATTWQPVGGSNGGGGHYGILHDVGDIVGTSGTSYITPGSGIGGDGGRGRGGGGGGSGGAGYGGGGGGAYRVNVYNDSGAGGGSYSSGTDLTYLDSYLNFGEAQTDGAVFIEWIPPPPPPSNI